MKRDKSPIINEMFSGGVGSVLKHVVTSWEVIVVTLAFILYVFIVNYVARSYHRPRAAKKLTVKKKKAPPAETFETPPSSTDELGLEED